jgi:hypothetical protein
MDPRERMEDQEETLLAALDGRQANIWTALPGIIQSYNAEAMTAVVQPSIQIGLQQPDGSFVNTALPLLLDCPVIFPNGGGFTLTFPIAAGDECLVLFANRCIDAWWQNGGVQPQAEFRMHDLSDGFAQVGPFSQPRRLENVSAANVQLRNNAGDVYIEMQPNGRVRIQAIDIQLHATERFAWDVNGYGVSYKYEGANVWQVDTYFNPVPPQVVNTDAHDINPPEIPG